ncbi:hypothetical protein Ccrd_025122, partial [Cynara cardunculus var. scolymus]
MVNPFGNLNPECGVLHHLIAETKENPLILNPTPLLMVKEKKEIMKRNRKLKPIEGGIKWKNKQKRILLIVEEEVLLKTTTTFMFGKRINERMKLLQELVPGCNKVLFSFNSIFYESVCLIRWMLYI